MSYTYAKATNGRQTVRRSAIVLPSSKSISINYGTSPSHDDELSRVTNEKDSTIRLAVYEYNGVADVVGTTYAEANVKSVVYGSSPGTFDDLDTFGRITRSKWTTGGGKDFYKVEIGYDRNSNIAYVDDKVHTGFDALYTIDSLNRLATADEGTRSGASITSRTRKQEWTLSHTGNWDREKLDLDGNGSWGGANEHDDTRTHTKANEIATRDTDSNSSVNYTLVHDLDGNLTDDNQSYKYVWDVFGRLRTVKNQSNTVIAEYRYNGLGFRIAWHEDTDNDGDSDASDKWFYPMYDEAWRMVAVFRESDSSPKEEWVPKLAGLDGFGGSSQLDGVICRYRDANTAWTAASDGVLEERRYLCQNWRGDVSAIVDTAGAMVEWVKYSSYGIPFALPAGDANSSGGCDSSDTTQIQTWINGSVYDVRGDLDLDGDVDATDKTLANNNFVGITLGFSVLSNVGNRRGYAGYERDIGIATIWHVRHRVLHSGLGRWLSRDPYFEGAAFATYQYAEGAPHQNIDDLGLLSLLSGPQGTPSGHGPAINPTSSGGGSHPQNPQGGAPPGLGPLGQVIPYPVYILFEGTICCSVPSTTPDKCNYPLCKGYLGANEQCVCACVGNDPFTNAVRGCLQCAFDNGMGDTEAHVLCYACAAAKVGPPPAGWLTTFTTCVAKCTIIQQAICENRRNRAILLAVDFGLTMLKHSILHPLDTIRSWF